MATEDATIGASNQPALGTDISDNVTAPATDDATSDSYGNTTELYIESNSDATSSDTLSTDYNTADSMENTNTTEMIGNTNSMDMMGNANSMETIISSNPIETINKTNLMEITTPQLPTPSLFDLPELSLQLIYAYLGLKQLTRLSLTCKAAYTSVPKASNLWKHYYVLTWLGSEVVSNNEWLIEFRAMYAKYGKYMNCYAPILLSWQRIYNKLKQANIDPNKLFAPGATEQELDELEKKLTSPLPRDYRFFLTMHNGQIKPEKSDIEKFPHRYFFFGTYLSFYDVIDTHSYLLSTKDIYCSENQPGCKIIQINEDGNLQTFSLCITGNNTISTGEMFHPITENTVISIGRNFTEWFTQFSIEMESFPIDGGFVKRYCYDPKCIMTTNNIQIKVCTALSNKVLHRYYSHNELLMIYHITISMDQSVPNSESAKLETRHWLIKNSKGENIVDGPGVVGKYPLMKPGEIFTYTSGNYVADNWATMEGHFTFKHLKNQHTFNVTVPQFQLMLPTTKNI